MAMGAEIAGEEYLLLGSRDVDEAIRKIKETKPDVILNTINGDSNVPFFDLKQYRSCHSVLLKMNSLRRDDGQFDIVWASNKPVQPIPYPPTRPKSEWNKFLQDLYEGWGQTWENSGKRGFYL